MGVEEKVFALRTMSIPRPRSMATARLRCKVKRR
jgi:hypothetical protein